jgi:uncharacterized protein YjbI with pentapeptide repeats
VPPTGAAVTIRVGVLPLVRRHGSAPPQDAVRVGAGWQAGAVARRIGDVTLPALEPSGGPLADDAVLDGVELRGLDLSGQSGVDARLLESAVTDCVLDDVTLDGARIGDCLLTDVRSHTLSAVGSTWRDVALTGCRLGAVQLSGAELQRVRVTGGKVDYLNLRDARLTDVVLEGCVVGELDLVGATATRVTLDGCRVERLDVTRATLDRVDLRGADLSGLDGLAHLRGAVISGDQLLELAPALAAHLGVRVVDR